MRLPMRFSSLAILVLVFAAGPRAAWADGPPPRSLVPSAAGAAAESLAAIEAGVDRALAADEGADRPASDARAGRGPRPLIRRAALAAGVGFAAVAVWRGAVANDREAEYDRAIFSTSSSALREQVREAEGERNLAAALAGTAFSLALFTFVF